MHHDKVNPEVSLELGGKERKLVFDFWAFSEAERLTGKNYLSDGILNKPGFGEIMHLIWAGLQATEPNMMPKDVGRLMKVQETDKYLEAIVAGIQKAQSENNDEEAPKEKKD